MTQRTAVTNTHTSHKVIDHTSTDPYGNGVRIRSSINEAKISFSRMAGCLQQLSFLD
jgi:hypothetical protein